MESTDQKILALLARDGRMSFTDIGRETGLSTSAAQQRVRRLEQRGLICGYRARLNGKALGRSLVAFVKIIPVGHVTDDTSVVELLEQMPEITACYSVAGDASYLCQAEVGSPEDLDDLLTRIRIAQPVATSTTIVLRTMFADRPLVDEPGAPNGA
ncbi:Lrp/AsnC family transcriptional regulator [Propionibacterium australiense]|nr:Lrp/AsnC family transcriptional regulator [Propionibacterium australiense]RLP06474.1 AsnC family transcriptional regulator [Propionibacterium australiense]RLP11778.1 AsnC family transcriptional regulator [Propionibacterium australiense]